MNKMIPFGASFYSLFINLWAQEAILQLASLFGTFAINKSETLH